MTSILSWDRDIILVRRGTICDSNLLWLEQVKQACLVIQRARGELLYRFTPNSITDVQYHPLQTCAVKVLPGFCSWATQQLQAALESEELSPSSNSVWSLEA